MNFFHIFSFFWISGLTLFGWESRNKEIFDSELDSFYETAEQYETEILFVSGLGLLLRGGGG